MAHVSEFPRRLLKVVGYIVHADLECRLVYFVSFSLEIQSHCSDKLWEAPISEIIQFNWNMNLIDR